MKSRAEGLRLTSGGNFRTENLGAISCFEILTIYDSKGALPVSIS